MQASRKEAHGSTASFRHSGEGRGGKGIDCDVARIHLSQIWISGQPGNPRSIRDGRAMPEDKGPRRVQEATRPSQRSELGVMTVE